MASITSANSSFVINVSSVFQAPIIVQQYATDDSFETDDVAPTEAKMGVDGVLSFGYTPYPVKLKFMLQANSPTILLMDAWREAMDAVLEAFTADATIISPALGKVWTFTNGTLTGAKPTPPGKKTFNPQNYELTFNKVIAAPYSGV